MGLALPQASHCPWWQGLALGPYSAQNVKFERSNRRTGNADNEACESCTQRLSLPVEALRAAAALRSIRARLAKAVCLSGAVMVTWPIFLCRATSALPYQCTDAPATCNKQCYHDLTSRSFPICLQHLMRTVGTTKRHLRSNKVDPSPNTLWPSLHVPSAALLRHLPRPGCSA